MPDPKTFEITTTAQVERTYIVQATNEDQAHKRLRSFIADADAVREGVVVEQEAKRRDTTPQKVNGKRAVSAAARPKTADPT